MPASVEFPPLSSQNTTAQGISGAPKATPSGQKKAGYAVVRPNFFNQMSEYQKEINGESLQKLLAFEGVRIDAANLNHQNSHTQKVKQNLMGAPLENSQARCQSQQQDLNDCLQLKLPVMKRSRAKISKSMRNKLLSVGDEVVCRSQMSISRLNNEEELDF